MSNKEPCRPAFSSLRSIRSSVRVPKTRFTTKQSLGGCS
jgi:hypothetical protein